MPELLRKGHFLGAKLRSVRKRHGLTLEDLSVLDLYVATASRWSPGRRRFNNVAPGLAEAIRRVDAHPRLTKLWAERFPFVESWEE